MHIYVSQKRPSDVLFIQCNPQIFVINFFFLACWRYTLEKLFTFLKVWDPFYHSERAKITFIHNYDGRLHIRAVRGLLKCRGCWAFVVLLNGLFVRILV